MLSSRAFCTDSKVAAPLLDSCLLLNALSLLSVGDIDVLQKIQCCMPVPPSWPFPLESPHFPKKRSIHLEGLTIHQQPLFFKLGIVMVPSSQALVELHPIETANCSPFARAQVGERTLIQNCMLNFQVDYIHSHHPR